MADHLFEIVTTLTTLIAGGGWFVNWRLKKKVEKYSAYSDNVDLTDKILHKYQESVLSAMENQTSGQNEIKEKLENVIQVTSEISEFLNGDFVQFQIRKRNDDGKIECKTLKPIAK